MHLKSTPIGLLIVVLVGLELPTPAVAQFWKKSVSNGDPNSMWRSETLAERPPGICYRSLIVETVNPNSRMRTISYCCDGYVNRGNSQNVKCEPICREDCSNGVCITPGSCECAPGYFRKNAKCRNEQDYDQ
ncbi:hypothetical protein KR084_006563 [Drosophila pseudotakahashii]|nr:hypothetical protein KR084_006563 [Drosophila pseudotakahashii]